VRKAAFSAVHDSETKDISSSYKRRLFFVQIGESLTVVGFVAIADDLIHKPIHRFGELNSIGLITV
jgi:hypothetical protein